MKANFLVTPHPAARIADADHVFAGNPYVTHVLERTGDIDRYAEVVTATAPRATREEFLRDHEFVDLKFRRYTQIIVQRLCDLHGAPYDGGFWRKALSLALLRHTALCFDLFQVCESHLQPERHDCRVLAEAGYYVPRDFNEHRRFFQHSDYGQEQLFSVYCRTFHPGVFAQWEGRHEWPARPATAAQRRPPLSALPRRIARRLMRMRRPTVAIVNAYFSEETIDRLLFASRGRIQRIRLPAPVRDDGPLDWTKRDFLCRAEESCDRFDRFAFAALRHGMPRAFVEDAPAQITSCEELFSAYPQLRWAVCEAWIGDMYSSMALAVLGQRGVRHLYNEHNYLAYPFLGNNLKYLIPLTDAFVTMGWKAPDYPAAIPGASLFPWTDSVPRTGGDDILYIASLPQVRAPEVNSSYGDSGPVNVPRYFEFVESFLAALSGATRGEMVVRAYPVALPRTIQAWDFKYRLRKLLAEMKLVDDSERGARALMRSAKLVVVDYFSTSFIEAMLADLPTLFLWNRSTRYIADAHRDFFTPLAREGICQVDPVAAAQFVERIKHDPQSWWQRPAVRNARRDFLAANVGQPDVLVHRLLRLAAPA
jgi:putative transferase (TIGR04331 family)